MKKILLIDMDGVLVELNSENWAKKRLEKGYFLNNKPIEGSIKAFEILSVKYDCHIVSTPVWDNPDCWKEKRLWVEKYLGEKAKKRLTLTHNKNLFKGDYIIDDSGDHGVDKFKEKHIHFGSDKFPDWNSVLEYLM
ncbi:MAG: hypothetical protein JEZ01_11025 [Labilibaculum sp.]|nr:hypothetical protein [Labilibaculum sp.]MBI9058289.1 hypothetical protein [Labilibaculum sp.]